VSRPAAVAFDNDGLLLDTEYLWTLAEEKLFGRRGLEFTHEHKLQVIGASAEVAGPLFAGLLDEPGREAEIMAELEGLVMIEAQDGGKPMSGARELVGALGAAGVPLALVSNSPPKFVRAVIGPSGLEDAFEFLVTPFDGFRPKPAPDLYLEASRRLGSSPTEMVVLEDSRPGVGGALAAGARVIGVPSVPGVDLEGCEVLAGSLLDPEVWEALGLPRP
jgi:HAD superfamily hydrolase (TIGR01509 family)